MIILVAEDEAVIALVLDGHQVLGPVATAKDALQLAEQGLPALALIGINLAHGDDAVGLARTHRDRWRVPSLFLSGQTGAVVAVTAILAGQQPKEVPAHLELSGHGKGAM